MKKIRVGFVTLFMVLMCVFGVLLLSACGGTTYHFVSARVETEGEIKEYEIGDELANGLIARKNMITIQIKPDGNVVMKIQMAFFSEKRTGTWEEIEGDPNNLVFDIDDVTFTCRLDGSKLLLADTTDTAVLTFEK